MHKIKVNLKRDHNIYLVGDTHRETPFSHSKAIKQTIDTIASDPLGHIIYMGDMITALTTKDKRFMAESMGWQVKEPLTAMVSAAHDFRHLKKKGIVAIRGNHERKLHDVGDLVRDVFCKELDTPYGSDSCKVFVTDSRGREQYGLGVWHPDLSFTSKLADPMAYNHALERFLYKSHVRQFEDCVIRAMPHIHQLYVMRPNPEMFLTGTEDLKQHYTEFKQMPKPGSRLWPNMIYNVATGSFEKAFTEPVLNPSTGDYVPISSYAERKGYRPNKLGYIKITVRGYQIENVEPVTV